MAIEKAKGADTISLLNHFKPIATKDFNIVKKRIK